MQVRILKRECASDMLVARGKGSEGRGLLRVASMDIGTNSTRLLVAEMGADWGFRRVFGDRRIDRLGEGLQQRGRLDDAAIQRTLETLSLFLGEARGRGAQRILAAATSAVRDASNGRRFAKLVEATTGLELRVLSGEEEARWMMRGVSLLWPSPPERWMALDIGGGSTEIVWSRFREVERAESLPVGMVRLTEGTFSHDPPFRQEIGRCRELAREAFIQTLGETLPPQARPEVLVGTAGTITNLAALDLHMAPYDGERVNGHRLTRGAVERWCSVLARMTSAERRTLHGMEPGREDVILAGALMVAEFLAVLGMDGLWVSDFGLLEGIALMAAETEAKAEGKAEAEVETKWP
jgi:exopolyphosphatase/guanosine-5'-triphosphate,3'-diphosphate pyrophosphatase